MVAILELPEVRQMVSPISVENYHQMPEFNQSGRRTELICGLITEKMGKSPLHAPLLRYLFLLVQAAADAAGLLALKEDPLTLADSEPEPDISVVPGQSSDYRDTHPATALLAIEVAVTSVVLDREKAALYAEANVQEYWIVLANDEAIEVHTLPVDGRYTQRRVYTRGGTLPCATLPALSVELATLFAGLIPSLPLPPSPSRVLASFAPSR